MRAEIMREVLRDRDKIAASLAAAQQRVGELEAELQRIQARDPLIAPLLSLPAFRAQLELDVQRSQRYGRSLTLVLMDVDAFDAVNRRHGYAAGDQVLITVGKLLASKTRAHDLACRAGDDEFAMLMPEASTAEAKVALERFMEELENIHAGPVTGISVSAGIAELGPQGDANRVLAEANSALHRAREEGGSRVVISVPGVTDKPKTTASAFGSSLEMVAGLARTLEERDRYTAEHSDSVVDLVVRVSEALAIDEDEVKIVATAALLHDIGKVGVPDEVLHKPGPLDDDEWEIMRQHPVIGERILRAIPGMGSIARVIRHEHERWDGGGYPDGLAEENVPLGARIILACDAYHAMVSDRPYRKAMPHSEAVAELTRNAGSQFDPRVVEALVGYLYGRRQAGLATV